MTTIIKTVIPFSWNTIVLNFVQGTAGTVNLATFLVNQPNKPITYTMTPGSAALPSGTSLAGSGIVTYNGTGPVAQVTVQFRAASGSQYTDSSPTPATIATTSLGQVTGLAASSITQTSFTLSWTAVAGALDYLVERSPNGTGSWTARGTPTGTSYGESGLTAGTAYWYRVTARNVQQTGSASAALMVTTVAVNVPASWVTAADLGTLAAGASFNFPLTATDPESDAISFSYSAPPFGSATEQAQAGTTRVLRWSGTAPSVTVDTDYLFSAALGAAAGGAEADWVARSTGAGVVWAHDFRHANELTNFLGAGTDPKNNGVFPRITADGPTGQCLEYVALGARFTADFGLTATTMSFDDLTYWPSGDFYFHVQKARILGGEFAADQQNNLFYCPPNNGSTVGKFGNELRGVQYSAPVSPPEQPFSNTRRAWVIGDVAGHHVSQTWTRPFCAFASPGNGLPANDVNNAGVTLRTWSPIATTPANTKFGYGWYGHPTHQAEFPSWTPQGGSLKTAPWDGDEFYLQFRLKVDPRFWQYNYPGAIAGQSDTDGAWGHKLFFIQSQQTVPQQLVGVLIANNRYAIPSTPTTPWQWYTTQAGRTLSSNLNGTGSYQPGSQWESTAIYGVSHQPAGSAWEWYTDEWLTVQIRIKPGLHWNRESNPSATGVRNSLLEVKIARPGQAYVTVFSQSDQALTYGSTSDSQGQWFDALPGYCAFIPTMYLNTDLGNPIPLRAYYHRFTQVILSKQAIAAPGAGA